MSQSFSLNRRAFLAGACCAAASPLITPISFAATPGDKRLVTILLRGALDGLYLVQPYTDPLLKTYRPDLALDPSNGLIDLDGQFGLHPEASSFYPLFRSGELAFVHAVSTPYRDMRSHFDGQDVLESGEAVVGGTQSGWLNRALTFIPRSDRGRAIDINTSADLILSGPNNVDVWVPQSNLELNSDELSFFERLYANDSAFSKAFGDAVSTDSNVDTIFNAGPRKSDIAGLASLAAGMLKSGYTIANFSIGGWDTHVNQKNVFRAPIKNLVNAIGTLKTELGAEIWAKTAVLVVTEFGRTVRQTGTAGTDHGTGGLAIVAGGAIRGGKVYGKWPGLAEDRLFENRDLMPTGDVREIAAALLYSQFGVAKEALTGTVFPGLSMDIASQGFLRG